MYRALDNCNNFHMYACIDGSRTGRFWRSEVESNCLVAPFLTILTSQWLYGYNSFCSCFWAVQNNRCKYALLQKWQFYYLLYIFHRLQLLWHLESITSIRSMLACVCTCPLYLSKPQLCTIQAWAGSQSEAQSSDSLAQNACQFEIPILVSRAFLRQQKHPDRVTDHRRLDWTGRMMLKIDIWASSIPERCWCDCVLHESQVRVCVRPVLVEKAVKWYNGCSIQFFQIFAYIQ